MKPRSDSVLKTLHPSRQLQIWEWCQGGSYEAVVAKIKAEWQIVTSVSSLSGFYSWYPFRNKLEQANELKAQLRDTLRDMPDLDLSDEQLSKAGQAIFENEAIRTQDPKLFIEMRRLRQKDRDQEAVERRLQLLEQREEKAKKVLGDEKLTPEQKDAKMRAVFGLPAKA